MRHDLIKKGLSILDIEKLDMEKNEDYKRHIMGIPEGKTIREEAIEILLRAKRTDPKDYLVWWVLGNAYKKNNQNDKALDCFLKVIELGITYDYHDYLADIYSYDDKTYLNYDSYFEKSLIKEPIYKNIWYELGETYFLNGKYEEAIDCYLKSNYSGIEENIGDAYCKMGQYKEAIDNFLTYYKATDEPMIKLANAYYSNGQFNEAIETLLKSTERFPKVCNSLGCLYLMNGDYEKAIDSFLKAPNYIIWMELEDVYKIEGFYKKSIDYLAKIAETGPNDNLSDIWGLLGISCYKIGSLEAAIEGFLNSTELYHEDYIIWSLLGISYILNEQYEEALEALLTATELKHDSYFAWFYLGFLYYNNKKYNEAIKILLKVSKLDILDFGNLSKSFLLSFSLKNTYYKNGEYKYAGEFFLKNIGIASDGHQLWIMLGHSYYAIGEYDEAKESYLKANKLNPNDKTSLEMLEKLNTILKNKEKEEEEEIKDNIIFKMASKDHPFM